MKNVFFLKLCFFLLLYLWYNSRVNAQEGCPSCSNPGSELVFNGDFAQVLENNYSTSPPFQLPLWRNGGSLTFGDYYITNDPALHNGQWSGADHTNGTGNFLICDGIIGIETSAWGQEIDISAYAPNTNFVFSAWVSNLCNTNVNFADPKMQLRVNGALLLWKSVILPEIPDEWVYISAVWNSGPTPPNIVTIEVVSVITDAIGDDLGIDDVSFKACLLTTNINVSAGPDLSICLGDSIQLNAISNANTFSWFPPIGLNANNIPNPIASPNSSTIYIVTASSDSSCIGVDTLVVVVDTSKATASFNFSVQPCSFVVSFLNLSSSANQYKWNFGVGNVDTTSNPTHVYQSPGNYNVSLIATGSCRSDTVSQTININLPPAANSQFTFSQDQCSPEINFINQSSNSIGCYWLFGDNSWSDSIGPSHNYTLPGNYAVTLISFDSCSSDTAMQIILINPVVLPAAHFTYGQTMCTLSAEFSNQSTGGLNYYWLFGDGNYSTSSNPVYTYGTPGIYEVSLIVSNICGNDSIVGQVVIAENIMQPEFSYQQDSCNNEVVFINKTINAISYRWDFGDASIDTSFEPVHEYKKAGDYLVRLLVANACDTQIVFHTINAGELIPFVEISNIAVDKCSLTLTYNSESVNASSILWNFGDGNVASFPDGTHQYNAAGEYFISLIINENHRCPKEVDTSITIAEEYFHLFIPNAFTPNDDGTNDFFEIKSISNCIVAGILIFNRWGNLVFESDNSNVYWDGKLNGEMVAEDVYVYIIKSEKKEIVGHVSVLR